MPSWLTIDTAITVAAIAAIASIGGILLKDRLDRRARQEDVDGANLAERTQRRDADLRELQEQIAVLTAAAVFVFHEKMRVYDEASAADHRRGTVSTSEAYQSAMQRYRDAFARIRELGPRLVGADPTGALKDAVNGLMHHADRLSRWPPAWLREQRADSPDDLLEVSRLEDAANRRIGELLNSPVQSPAVPQDRAS